jgi:hypothetical protein
MQHPLIRSALAGLRASFYGLIGHLIAFFTVCAIIWWVWSAIAPTYFTLLPAVYQTPPYLHFVGFVLLVNFFGRLIRGVGVLGKKSDDAS